MTHDGGKSDIGDALAAHREAAAEGVVDRPAGRQRTLEGVRRRQRRLVHHEAGGGSPDALAGMLCLLRTAPGQTMQLATSLAKAGIDAWTPVESKRVRRPRSNKRVTRQRPILAGFVFADAERLTALRRAQRDETGTHPPFRLWENDRGVWVTDEAEIAPLRVLERDTASQAAGEERKDREREEGKLKKADKPHGKGETAKAPAGPFTGLVGTVDRSDVRHTHMTFGKSGMRVRFQTLQIIPDRVGTGES